MSGDRAHPNRRLCRARSCTGQLQQFFDQPITYDSIWSLSPPEVLPAGPVRRYRAIGTDTAALPVCSKERFSDIQTTTYSSICEQRPLLLFHPRERPPLDHASPIKIFAESVRLFDHSGPVAVAIFYSTGQNRA